ERPLPLGVETAVISPPLTWNGVWVLPQATSGTSPTATLTMSPVSVRQPVNEATFEVSCPAKASAGMQTAATVTTSATWRPRPERFEVRSMRSLLLKVVHEGG